MRTTTGKTFVPDWCEAANATCVLPVSHSHGGLTCGNMGENSGDLDVWEVWHDLAAQYTLDPTPTVMRGMSYGGICTAYFGGTHPDMFTQICNLEGVILQDPRLENLRWVPDCMAVTTRRSWIATGLEPPSLPSPK